MDIVDVGSSSNDPDALAPVEEIASLPSVFLSDRFGDDTTDKIGSIKASLACGLFEIGIGPEPPAETFMLGKVAVPLFVVLGREVLLFSEDAGCIAAFSSKLAYCKFIPIRKSTTAAPTRKRHARTTRQSRFGRPAGPATTRKCIISPRASVDDSCNRYHSYEADALMTRPGDLYSIQPVTS